MTDLAEMQARLAALKRARDSGVLIVRHGDVSTQFRTLSEIERIIADLSKEIGAIQGKPRRGPSYVRQRSKGL